MGGGAPDRRPHRPRTTRPRRTPYRRSRPGGTRRVGEHRQRSRFHDRPPHRLGTATRAASTRLDDRATRVILNRTGSLSSESAGRGIARLSSVRLPGAPTTSTTSLRVFARRCTAAMRCVSSLPLRRSSATSPFSWRSHSGMSALTEPTAVRWSFRERRSVSARRRVRSWSCLGPCGSRWS